MRTEAAVCLSTGRYHALFLTQHVKVPGGVFFAQHQVLPARRSLSASEPKSHSGPLHTVCYFANIF